MDAATWGSSPAPELEFVFEASIALAPLLEVGPTQRGQRRIVPIAGGSFAGPRLRGEILAGGADWQFVRADGVLELEARYVLRADDGTHISVINRGLRRNLGPPDNEPPHTASGSAAVYFRAAPVFEAPAGAHAWLNESLFVSTGVRNPDDVRLRVYRVA